MSARAVEERVRDGQVLVLGLGNVLRGDEGLGVHALQRLTDGYVLPPQVEAVDGGTLGLDLLPYLDGTPALLVIDAVQAGRTPGSLVRLQDEAIMPALALKLSLHQAGLRELLATSRLLGTHPAHVVLLGVEPDTIGWTTELSAPVAASMDALLDAVADELRGWGVMLEDRRP
jgi:hydrogenase maturation protease